jgi:hypothetical protein
MRVNDTCLPLLFTRSSLPKRLQNTLLLMRKLYRRLLSISLVTHGQGVKCSHKEINPPNQSMDQYTEQQQML